MALSIVWNIPSGIENISLRVGDETHPPGENFWLLPFHHSNFKIFLPIDNELRIFEFTDESTTLEVMEKIYSMYSSLQQIWFHSFVRIGNNFYLAIDTS